MKEEGKALELQGKAKARGFEISQDQILGEGCYVDINSKDTIYEHTLPYATQKP